MFNICLECVKLSNIAVHNYDVFRFKFVHIHYTDKLYCLKLIKVKVNISTLLLRDAFWLLYCIVGKVNPASAPSLL